MAALFSPISLSALTLPNRISVSPMCQYSAEDGSATDWHRVHYGALANSGAGLLVFEASGVTREGRITHGCLGIYSDANEAALKPILAFARAHGSAKLGIQLAHAGRKASAQVPWEGGNALGPTEQPWETLAPSAVPFGDGWHTPRAMTAADLAAVKEAFVASAKRALRLGFDQIELHVAHGYLLHQFVSPLSNRRTDAYGGSLENRLRYPLEVAKAVREVWPRDRALGARISGSDWMEGGAGEAEAVALGQALRDVGFDMLCVTSGAMVPTAKMTIGPGYQVEFAAAVKRATGLATRAVGLITEPEQAERIIAEGKADMVALARGFLDNPHWAWHAAAVLGADVARPPQYARAAPKLWPGAAKPAR